MIVALSTRFEPPSRVNCIICSRNITFTQATTCFARGEYGGFACARHLDKSEERRWYRFVARRQIVSSFASVVKGLVVLS